MIIALWIYAALVMISSIVVIWGAAQFVGIRFYTGISIPFALASMMYESKCPIPFIVVIELIGLLWFLPFFCINLIIWLCALPFNCGKSIVEYLDN